MFIFFKINAFTVRRLSCFNSDWCSWTVCRWGT